MPSARRVLAKEKRAGPLREYLTELQAGEGRPAERWCARGAKGCRRRGRRRCAPRPRAGGGAPPSARARLLTAATSAGPCRFYTEWLRKLARQQEMAARGAARRAALDSAAGGGAAAAPGGQQAAAPPPPQQQAAAPQPQPGEYVDKQPAFWSLDNPLIATAALIAAFGGAATLLRGLGGA